ncbi:MAG: cytochrome c oxidase subunit II [Deltaproteobacteria bacterium]|nr:cytochrome c oxidase subunit II [Deltaproteobacteria bacterium]
MSIHAPPADWFKAPSGGERVWIGLAVIWCLVLSAMMPYWHFKGKQNSTGESYSVKPMDFFNRVETFVKAGKVADEKGVPVVTAAPGSDIYLLGRMWQWHPILKIKKGQTYRLHVSSMDLQHGFSLMPLNMNFQVLPGYDHVLTITPTAAGDYPIICNEFCGIGHHLMTGKIIVEE